MMAALLLQQTGDEQGVRFVGVLPQQLVVSFRSFLISPAAMAMLARSTYVIRSSRHRTPRAVSVEEGLRTRTLGVLPRGIGQTG
jgi:hypothetical protein